jgi:hypothetical protein
MLLSVFYDTIFGQSVSSGGFHSQHKIIPLNGFESSLEQITGSFTISPQIQHLMSPMYHYSASCLSIYTIEFRLRHRFCRLRRL